jgi:hypothetical protein
MTAHVFVSHLATSLRMILVAFLLINVRYCASAQSYVDSNTTGLKESCPRPFYCSCANPLPLALANGSSTAPTPPMTRTWYPGRPLKPSGSCRSLPSAGPGEACGDAIAICSKVREARLDSFKASV